jgi:hypothetical protein
MRLVVHAGIAGVGRNVYPELSYHSSTERLVV